MLLCKNIKFNKLPNSPFLKKINYSKYLLIFTWLVILTLFFSTIFYTYRERYNIYYIIGNRAFGGEIMNQKVYNLDIAEFFLIKANEKKNPELWTNYQLSRINFIRGNLIQAIYFANEELRLYPNNCRTHYIRGLAYGYAEDLDNAISDFEIFNKCFPNSWAGHNDLAWFWFKKGDTKKVIQIIEKVKDFNMGSAWVQNTYGVALMNEGRYNEAEKALLSAKQNSANMTEEDWGKSYPGNNPLIYKKGLTKLRESIDSNLRILQQKKGGL